MRAVSHARIKRRPDVGRLRPSRRAMLDEQHQGRRWSCAATRGASGANGGSSSGRDPGRRDQRAEGVANTSGNGVGKRHGHRQRTACRKLPPGARRVERLPGRLLPPRVVSLRPACRGARAAKRDRPLRHRPSLRLTKAVWAPRHKGASPLDRSSSAACAHSGCAVCSYGPPAGVACALKVAR